jgi:hypothetical protein
VEERFFGCITIELDESRVEPDKFRDGVDEL